MQTSSKSGLIRTVSLAPPVSLSNTSWMWLAGLFLLLVIAFTAMWLPLAPTRLFDFDAANFALSLDQFNPALHQPQPPGYPLYSGISRMIHVFIPDPALVFLVAGILGACVAVLTLGRLGQRMFGRDAGIFAALLLMTNPILWEAGMSNQVRVYLAVISGSVALAAWPEWERPFQHGRFRWACLLLGLLAGFRPETLFSMAPLLVFTGIRAKIKLRDWLVGALALSVGVAPWFAVLVISMGGFHTFHVVMQSYAQAQAGGSSVVMGAKWSAVLKMFDSALWWVSLGLAAWLPALLLLAWTKFRDSRTNQMLFLLAWFLPQFLFSVAIHIAAPGHSLGFVPVLCLAGGWTLANIGRNWNPRFVFACVALAMALNVLFFFKPYSRGTKEASYKTVSMVADINQVALARIDAVASPANTFLVTYDGWIPWRVLEYYYPGFSILYLPGPSETQDPAAQAWLVQKKRVTRQFPATQTLELPACGTLVWLVTDDQSRRDLLAVPGAVDERYIITIPAQPGMQFQLGHYHLEASHSPCGK